MPTSDNTPKDRVDTAAKSIKNSFLKGLQVAFRPPKSEPEPEPEPKPEMKPYTGKCGACGKEPAGHYTQQCPNPKICEYCSIYGIDHVVYITGHDLKSCEPSCQACRGSGKIAKGRYHNPGPHHPDPEVREFMEYSRAAREAAVKALFKIRQRSMLEKPESGSDETDTVQPNNMTVAELLWFQIQVQKFVEIAANLEAHAADFAKDAAAEGEEGWAYKSPEELAASNGEGFLE